MTINTRLVVRRCLFKLPEAIDNYCAFESNQEIVPSLTRVVIRSHRGAAPRSHAANARFVQNTPRFLRETYGKFQNHVIATRDSAGQALTGKYRFI